MVQPTKTEEMWLPIVCLNKSGRSHFQLSSTSWYNRYLPWPALSSDLWEYFNAATLSIFHSTNGSSYSSIIGRQGYHWPLLWWNKVLEWLELTVHANSLRNCQLSSDKTLRQKGRKLAEIKICVSDNVGLRAINRFDNRAVTILTTFEAVVPSSQVRRWDCKEKKELLIDCPTPAIS